MGSVDHCDSLAGVLRLSERERTHAARHLPDDVPAAVKAARLQEVIAAFREGLAERFAAGATGHKIVRAPTRLQCNS